MDGRRIDELAKALASGTDRRRVLKGLLGGGAAGTLALLGARGAGAQTTCKENGRRCTGGAACCSGRCARAADGTKRCRRSPGQGTCTVERNLCSGATEPCNGRDCSCFITATGRSLCGDLTATADLVTDCSECPGGKVCVRGGGSNCPGVAFACVAPCPPPA